MRFLVKVLVSAVALWLVTLIMAPNVWMQSYGSDGDVLPLVITYLIVALIFGIVNAIVGTAIRIVAFPIYILTLGLISFVINGLLLLLAAWVSNLLGFGLRIEGFWWGVLAAFLLGVFSWVIGLILRPITRDKPRTR
jgi:putative membrane protein